MAFKPANNSEVYCFLKHTLEPRYRVIAEPSTEYYSEWKYCYRIFEDEELLYELKGDLLAIPDGELVNRAVRITQELQSRLSSSR